MDFSLIWEIRKEKVKTLRKVADHILIPTVIWSQAYLHKSVPMRTLLERRFVSHG